MVHTLEIYPTQSCNQRCAGCALGMKSGKNAPVELEPIATLIERVRARFQGEEWALFMNDNLSDLPSDFPFSDARVFGWMAEICLWFSGTTEADGAWFLERLTTVLPQLQAPVLSAGGNCWEDADSVLLAQTGAMYIGALLYATRHRSDITSLRFGHASNNVVDIGPVQEIFAHIDIRPALEERMRNYSDLPFQALFLLGSYGWKVFPRVDSCDHVVSGRARVNGTRRNIDLVYRAIRSLQGFGKARHSPGAHQNPQECNISVMPAHVEIMHSAPTMWQYRKTHADFLRAMDDFPSEKTFRDFIASFL